MLGDIDPADHTVESLRRAYLETLREAIETVGCADVATSSGIDRETVDAIATGGRDAITLTEATAILATVEDQDADAISADARDRLLLSMSNAVLDVDALARRLDGDYLAKELQAKIEGRHPMTVAEYARVQTAIAEES
ncbi:DUF5791 family protein [Halorhabdus amylolytica]|uniref:DUF5791 family protein n=1 Tax=Halorhabdus amylolytica TaxID=2559573 RepID=UPI0010A9C258|nr:DUF5791 family protein [Halorhabdus amylolytica]